MSNKSIENLIQSMTSLFISTIEKQPVSKGKISVEEILTSLNSEDIQEQIRITISEAMPKTTAKKSRSSSSPKEKKLKDENAPKRPKTAYLYFSEKVRPEIREENPELKMTEISKIIGEQWKQASPQSKLEYTKKADKDKARYKEEMEEYVRPSDEVLVDQKVNQKKTRGRKPSSGEEKKARKKKPDGAPKGAKSSYMYFCAAKRAEVKESFPDYKMTEISKELGRMWREDFHTDEDREEYVRLASQDKERYIQEKAEWEEKNGVEEKPVKQSKAKSPKDAKASKNAKASKDAKASKSKQVESDSEEEEPVSVKIKAKKASAKASASDSEKDKKKKASAKASASDDESDSDKKKKAPAKQDKITPSRPLVKIPSFIGDDDDTSSDDE